MSNYLLDDSGNVLTDDSGNRLTFSNVSSLVLAAGAYALTGIASVLTKAAAPILVHFRYAKH